MTTFLTVTLAAARNDELRRRGARPLPLSAIDAIRSRRRPKGIARHFLSHHSETQRQASRSLMSRRDWSAPVSQR
jgi:hypothetical protein